MKTALSVAGAVIVSVCLLILCFTAAFTAVAYRGDHFFREEYEKYDVYKDLPMEREEVLGASGYMMDYLIGRHDTLTYPVHVDGQEVDFFNEQDRFHMAEVGHMFRALYMTGALSLFALFVCVILYRMRGRTQREDVFCRLFQSYTIVATAVILFFIILAAAAVFFFEELFLQFHLLAFDNDKWLFDPSADYMIRMLPEGLFMDAFLQIASFFVLFAVAVWAGLCLARHNVRL